MRSAFTALPLPSGEAFLLETDHAGRRWNVLVDSGYGSGSPHPLVRAIKSASPKLTCIDIAVCTHQDADHANGFRTFADEWCGSGNTIGEFWLPGRWASVMPGILTNPAAVVGRLANGSVEVAKLLRGPIEATSIRDALEQTDEEQRLRDLAREENIEGIYSEVSAREQRRAEQGGGDQIVKVARSLGTTAAICRNLQRRIEEQGDLNQDVLAAASDAQRPFIYPWWLDDDLAIKAMTLFHQIVPAAESIAAIAQSAVFWEIPIRWFDFGEFERNSAVFGPQAAFGTPEILKPVCAVELVKPPTGLTDAAMFLCMRLSQQNVESLVFLRPEEDDQPAVLFTGDSRLCFGINSPGNLFPKPTVFPSRRMIVTAPHHGSRVNDAAYGIINGWIGTNGVKPIYVRSGGHWKQKLQGFRNQADRRCAQCRQCGIENRKVSIGTRLGNWYLRRRSAPPCP